MSDDEGEPKERSYARTFRAHVAFTVSRRDFGARFRVSTKPVRKPRRTEVTAAHTMLEPGDHPDLHPFGDKHAVVLPSWQITALSAAAADDGAKFVARLTADDLKWTLALAQAIAGTPKFRDDARDVGSRRLIVDWLTRLLVQAMASKFMMRRVLELQFGALPRGCGKIGRARHANAVRRWLFVGPPKVPGKTGIGYWGLRLKGAADPALHHPQFHTGPALTAAMAAAIARVARDDVETPMWAPVDAVRRMPPETQALMLAVPSDSQYAGSGSMVDGTLLLVLPQVNAMLLSLFSCPEFAKVWTALRHNNPGSKRRAEFAVRDLSLMDAYSMRQVLSHHVDDEPLSQAASQHASQQPEPGRRYAAYDGPQIFGGGRAAHCRAGGKETTSVVSMARRELSRAGQRSRKVLGEPASPTPPGDVDHVYTTDSAYAAGLFECASSFAYVREYVGRVFDVEYTPPAVAAMGDGQGTWAVRLPAALEETMVEAADGTRLWHTAEPWGDDESSTDSDADIDSTPRKRRRLPSRKQHAETARRTAALDSEHREAVPAHVGATQ